MKYTKDNFPEIVSTDSRSWTLLAKGFGMFCSILVPVATVSLAVSAFQSGAVPLAAKFFLMMLALLATFFFGWLIRAMIKTPRNSITHITVGERGIQYYCKHQLIRTLNYDELLAAPANEKYDVFLHNPYNNDDFSRELIIYILDPASNIVQRSAVLFNAQYLITNGNQLYEHFLDGIMIFRPDLSIDPYALNLYGLNV